MRHFFPLVAEQGLKTTPDWLPTTAIELTAWLEAPRLKNTLGFFTYLNPDRQMLLNELLFRSCKAKNQTALVLAVEAGADIEATATENGETVLHRACFMHDFGMVDYLLGKRADVTKRDCHQRTPLHYLCNLNKSRVYNDTWTGLRSSTLERVFSQRQKMFVENFFAIALLLVQHEVDVAVESSVAVESDRKATAFAYASTAEDSISRAEDLMRAALILTGGINFFVEFEEYYTEGLSFSNFFTLLEDILYPAMLAVADMYEFYSDQASNGIDLSANKLANSLLNPQGDILIQFIDHCRQVEQASEESQYRIGF